MNEVTVNLKQSIDQQVNELLKEYVKQVVGQYTYQIQKQIQQRLDLIIEDVVKRAVESSSFPNSSIPARSINWTDYKIDSQLLDNLPKQFKGIEDLSESVNLTVMNDAVVVETNLVSKHVEAENMTVTNLHLKNTNQPWIGAIAKYVEQNVRQHDYSIDINKAAVEMDKRLNELAQQIKRSTEMKELDVSGEAYLSETLYTTPGNHRVGINTMDPSDALTVWDQEAEIVIGKHKSQEGYLGTRRRQALNIGSNNKVGIRIDPTGAVEIDNLNLNGRVIGTSDTVPGDAAKRGDIRLNTEPASGQPIGWVCIDGIRWSAFGRIE